MIVEIQHANPYYDDSYAVNSANLGPYGDAIAIETELLPYIEKQFRRDRPGMGAAYLRRFYGRMGSFGGASFSPDRYNGAFVACPDPVDFRAYTTINLYEDKNALRSPVRIRTWSNPGCAII